MGEIRAVRARRTARGWLAVAASSALIVALAAAAVVAGIWGLTADRGGRQDGAAAIGEAVSLPGGAVRVERATFQSMDDMPTSGPGMSMPPMAMAPGTSLPDPPKGYERLNVDVTLLAARDAELRFRSASFRIGPPGMVGVPPVGMGSGPARLPGGTAASRLLAFDVPASARSLVLTVSGAERPITLTLAAADSAHGGAATRKPSVKSVGPGDVDRVIRRAGYRLAFRISPNRVGVDNTFSVRITRGGESVQGARVTLVTTLLGMDMGSPTYRLGGARNGIYRLAAPPGALAMAGRWRLSFEIVPPGGRPFTVRLVDDAAP